MNTTTIIKEPDKIWLHQNTFFQALFVEQEASGRSDQTNILEDAIFETNLKGKAYLVLIMDLKQNIIANPKYL
jgi:hypothetical protein